MVLAHMTASRGAMEGGHLHLLNGVSTQLKSMCFRQDTRDVSLRMPMLLALSELERLRSRNQSLKAQAMQEGWEWHLSSARLVPAGSMSEHQEDTTSTCSNAQTRLMTIVRARQLARRFKVKRAGDGDGRTSGTNTDNEEPDSIRTQDGPSVLYAASSIGGSKLQEGRRSLSRRPRHQNKGMHRPGVHVA